MKEIQDGYNTKYFFEYKKTPDDAPFDYCYITRRDSMFNFVGFSPEENGIISRCGVELFYSNRVKKNVQRKCAEIATILGKKYLLKGYDSKKDIYDFDSSSIVTHSPYTITMRIIRNTSGVVDYRIQVFYSLL